MTREFLDPGDSSGGSLGASRTDMQHLRRETGPTTGRGALRKQALVDAARVVFETKGFADTRISDIVGQAGVSHGTFYTYFATKDDIFTAVAHDVIQAMVSGMARSMPTTDFGARVHESVRSFVDVYRPHAKIIGLMEQLGTFTPEMRDLRLDVRDIFVQRTRRGISRMKQGGFADADLDAEYVAEALGAMLEYTCYVWLCLEKDLEEERLVNALAAIWTKTLQLK